MSYKTLAMAVLEDALEDLESHNKLDRISATDFFDRGDHEIWCDVAMLDCSVINQEVTRITT